MVTQDVKLQACRAILWLVLAAGSMLVCLAVGPGIGGKPCPCEARLVCQNNICNCTPGHEMVTGFASHQFVNVCLVSPGEPCEPNLLKEVNHDFYFDDDKLDEMIEKICHRGDLIGNTSHRYYFVSKASMMERSKRFRVGRTPTDWGCVTGRCISGICNDTFGHYNEVFRLIPYLNETLCFKFITTPRSGGIPVHGFPSNLVTIFLISVFLISVRI